MLKTMLWCFTVFGLLPVTLLALLIVASTLFVSVTRMRDEQPEPGSSWLIGDVYFQIGSLKPLHLSTSVWPALVVLFGAVAITAGLWALVPAQPRRISTGGFTHIEPQVETLLQSSKEHASLIISTPDGQHSIILMRYSGQTHLSIVVDRTKDDGEEARTATFFKRLGLSPTNEYLSENGGVEDAIHCFEYEVIGDAQSIGSLCVSVFIDLFEVDDKQGLDFRS